MLYLAEKYDAERKISYAPGTPEYIEQLSWFMLQVGGLGPMQGAPHLLGAMMLQKRQHMICFRITKIICQLTCRNHYIGQAHHFRIFADARSEYAIDRYYNETKRLYSVLDSRLKESPYLAGDKYTIADIMHFVCVNIAPAALEIDISEWPALKGWMERIKQREGVKKGLGVPKGAAGAGEIAEFMKKGRARIDAMTNADRY
jgi:glutathione S-transferase